MEIFDSTNGGDAVAKLNDETAIAVATTLLRAVQMRKKMNGGEKKQ